jgi:hypothetical protein
MRGESGAGRRPTAVRTCARTSAELLYSSTMTVSVAGALMRGIVSACCPAAAPGFDIVATGVRHE